MTGKAWQTFMAVCVQMDDPDFELTLEEWAVFYAAFQRARRAGAPFDPGFVDRVEALNRSALGGMEDSDDDVSVDDGLEDDAVDDRDDADEIGGNLGADPSPRHWWDSIKAERSAKTKSPDDRPILADEPATGLTQ